MNLKFDLKGTKTGIKVLFCYQLMTQKGEMHGDLTATLPAFTGAEIAKIKKMIERQHDQSSLLVQKPIRRLGPVVLKCVVKLDG